MASTFAWLDYSDRDRRHALDIIDLFREEETRDELGIGVIRDAFADRLFPGTSTIQTRVRYFLFLPWAFALMRSKDAAAAQFPVRSRLLQERIRRALMASGEVQGVIGYQAGAAVQRLPSSVYWQGLRRWGILRFNGSESDYQRELVRRQILGDHTRNDDGEPVDGAASPLWDPHLPKPPESWPEEVGFALPRHEAEYLRDRLEMAAPESLLTHLVDQGVEPADEEFVWLHAPPGSLPGPLREELEHARSFSESMHGAALLYNTMLAEAKGRDEWVEGYRSRIAEWSERRHGRAAELASWDRARFWSLLALWGAHVRPPTYAFVEKWLGGIRQLHSAVELTESEALRALIRHREAALKGSRARLSNPRALDLWRGSSGVAQLDYRWRDPVRSMIADIVAGLRSDH